jgi:hypothetical protein
MQEAVYINRCMGGVLDFSPILEHKDEVMAAFYSSDASIDTQGKQARKDFKARVHKRLMAFVDEVKAAYFNSEEGLRRVACDKINQDFYFDWLLETKDYQRLTAEDGGLGAYLGPQGRLLAPEGRLFDVARMYLSQGKVIKADDELMRFFKVVTVPDYQRQLIKTRRFLPSIQPFGRGWRLPIFLWRYVHQQAWGTMAAFNRDQLEKKPLFVYDVIKAALKQGDKTAARNHYLAMMAYQEDLDSVPLTDIILSIPAKLQKHKLD